MSTTTNNNSGLPPLPPYNPDNCDVRFAQGSVAALLAAIAPEFDKYLEELNKSQVGMMEAGLKAAESQGNSALAQGLLSGGISLVGAIAGGAGAYNATTQIATERTLLNNFNNIKANLQDKIDAVDKQVASLQIKPGTNPATQLGNKKVTLTEESPWKPQDPLGNTYKNEHTGEIRTRENLPKQVQIRLEEEKTNPSLEVQQNTKPQTKEDLHALKEKYENQIKDAENKYKSESRINEYNKNKVQGYTDVLGRGAEALGQPLVGVANKNNQIQQQAATIANSGAGQAQSAKESEGSTFNSVLGSANSLMDYGRALTSKA